MICIVLGSIAFAASGAKGFGKRLDIFGLVYCSATAVTVGF